MAAHRDAGPGRGRQLIIRRYLAPRRRVSISMTMKPALHGLDHSSRIHNAETRVLVSRLRAHVATKKAPLRRGFLLRSRPPDRAANTEPFRRGYAREGPGSGEDTRAKA